MSIKGQTVLITGGTGSFGHAFVRRILHDLSPKKVIVFSRDELKQFEMQQRFDQERYPGIRYFIGDVRDRDRLLRAFDGVDIVIHAAALKQVPAAEYNPLEAVKTNILGAANVIDAAIDRGVKKVVALSTDKAANPINLYGATKLCSDKLFIAGNAYVGAHETRFAVIRYGNVVGSRGSVVPLFREARERGIIPITDPRMTRFWITIDQGVQFVLDSVDRMQGGELFVPKIPSTDIVTLAEAIAPDCERKIIGIRPGEKLHELMISMDDARRTLDVGTYYLVQPEFDGWLASRNGGKPVPDGFSYTSDTNPQRLTVEEVRTLLSSLNYL